MKYKFKWKRWLFWQSRMIVGHKLEGGMMVLFMEDGGLETIPEWRKCKLKLGSDWSLAVKKNMENQSGVDIKTSF